MFVKNFYYTYFGYKKYFDNLQELYDYQTRWVHEDHIMHCEIYRWNGSNYESIHTKKRHLQLVVFAAVK